MVPRRDSRAHLLRKSTHERQANAGSFGLACELVFAPVEGLEQVWLVCTSDARTVVTNSERDATIDFEAVNENLLALCGAGVLQGVIDQVEEQLLQRVALERGRREVGVDIHDEGEPLRLCVWPEQLDDVPERLLERLLSQGTLGLLALEP